MMVKETLMAKAPVRFRGKAIVGISLSGGANFTYDIFHYSCVIQGSNRLIIQIFKHTALAGLWIVVQKLQKLGAFAFRPRFAMHL